MESFYQLPFKLDSLLKEDPRPLPKCSEKESIDKHLELLFITCPGEHKFDLEYGCRIWDMDFERIVSERQWEEDFSAYLTEAIKAYEVRLSDIEVKIQVSEITLQDAVKDTTTVKKKADVFLSGILNSTKERCRFRYKLLLGPLSSE